MLATFYTLTEWVGSDSGPQPVWAWHDMVLPPLLDYGPVGGHGAESCYVGGEITTCFLLPPGAPSGYVGPGYYISIPATEVCGNYGYGNECSGTPATNRRIATALSDFHVSTKWRTPEGYWADPGAFYGYIGSFDFPGNAAATMANVEKILSPFGAAAIDAGHAAAWVIYQQQVAINGSAGWTPANANPAAIIDYVVMTALSSPQFAGDARATAVLAFLDSPEWQAKVAAGWEQAAAYGRYHAAANESNSVFQGFLEAFSKFMIVAGPLMAITGAFAAILAEISSAAAPDAAITAYLEEVPAQFTPADTFIPDVSVLPDVSVIDLPAVEWTPPLDFADVAVDWTPSLDFADVPFDVADAGLVQEIESLATQFPEVNVREVYDLAKQGYKVYDAFQSLSADSGTIPRATTAPIAPARTYPTSAVQPMPPVRTTPSPLTLGPREFPAAQTLPADAAASSGALDYVTAPVVPGGPSPLWLLLTVVTSMSGKA